MIRKSRVCVLAAGLAGVVMLGIAPAIAVQPDEVLPDAALETRAREISSGLRCLVCQNQSIDDSNAPLARDLRLLVRERLKAGDTDDAVTAFVVARYGDFVLLKPPFNLATLALWLTPLLVLAGAVSLAIRAQRASSASARATDKGLTPEEATRLEALMREPRENG